MPIVNAVPRKVPFIDWIIPFFIHPSVTEASNPNNNALVKPDVNQHSIIAGAWLKTFGFDGYVSATTECTLADGSTKRLAEEQDNTTFTLYLAIISFMGLPSRPGDSWRQYIRNFFGGWDSLWPDEMGITLKGKRFWNLLLLLPIKIALILPLKLITFPFKLALNFLKILTEFLPEVIINFTGKGMGQLISRFGMASKLEKKMRSHWYEVYSAYLVLSIALFTLGVFHYAARITSLLGTALTSPEKSARNALEYGRAINSPTLGYLLGILGYITSFTLTAFLWSFIFPLLITQAIIILPTLFPGLVSLAQMPIIISILNIAHSLFGLIVAGVTTKLIAVHYTLLSALGITVNATAYTLGLVAALIATPVSIFGGYFTHKLSNIWAQWKESWGLRKAIEVALTNPDSIDTSSIELTENFRSSALSNPVNIPEPAITQVSTPLLPKIVTREGKAIKLYHIQKPSYTWWQWLKWSSLRLLFPPLIIWDALSWVGSRLIGRLVGYAVLPAQLLDGRLSETPPISWVVHFILPTTIKDNILKRFSDHKTNIGLWEKYFEECNGRRYSINSQQCVDTFRYRIKTHDGAELDTFEVQSQSQKYESTADKKYIIYFNGNGQFCQTAISDMFSDATSHNSTVIGFNFRGVGFHENKGYPLSSHDLVIDGIAQIQHLLSIGVQPENITLKCFSLGASIATLVTHHFHTQGYPIKVFNGLSFSTLTNAVVGLIRRGSKEDPQEKPIMKIVGWLAKPIIKFVLALTQWEINAVDAYKAIPKEYKEYIVGRTPREFRRTYSELVSSNIIPKNWPRTIPDDQIVTNYASLHAALKDERKAEKSVDEASKTTASARKMYDDRLPNNSVPGCIHNSSLTQLYNHRGKTAQDFFKEFAQKKPKALTEVHHGRSKKGLSLNGK